MKLVIVKLYFVQIYTNSYIVPDTNVATPQVTTHDGAVRHELCHDEPSSCVHGFAMMTTHPHPWPPRRCVVVTAAA